MNPESVTGLIFGLTGGLALFLYGMRVMSEGLSNAVGDGMRALLGRATRGRVSGLALGTVIGGLIQSSASIVLFIGFINAGLMTLAQSIAPILGANIGTTLSVQLISFKLSDYCLPAIFLGLMLNLIARKRAWKSGGQALLGFGLLFLGMVFMGDSIKPHRELFEPWLARVNGSTWSGLLAGTVASALITGVIQSSGAVIGMGFAMISAGAITEFEGIYPIIIGANIGTCVTGLIGSVGTSIDARRAALSHLLFNLFSTALAVAAHPLFYAYIPATSDDLIRQAANAGTIKMLATALLALPFTPLLAKIATWVAPSRKEAPESSHLDDALLGQPEQAIFACLRELRRATRICAESLRLAAEDFTRHDAKRVKRIRLNECSVNAIKAAMRRYLAALTKQSLSKRQSILIGHIDRCMSDVERVGDHVDKLADIAKIQRGNSAARFEPEVVEDWLAIHRAVEHLLEKVIESLNPETPDFQHVAKEIIDLRERYGATAIRVRDAHFERLESQTITPIAGLLFNDYLSNFLRVTKHVKNIALAEQHPRFWLKRETLGEETVASIREKSDAEDYLDQLQSDGFR